MKEISGEDVLKILGIDYQEKSGRLAFCCPTHADTDPSAALYLDTQLAHCFACGWTKPPILLYAMVQGTSRAEAVKGLERHLGPITDRKPRHNQHLHEAQLRKGNQRLAQLKHRPLAEHAYLAETLDRILLAYEKGQIDDERLDKALEIWYTRTKETGRVGPDHRRAAEAGLDDRLEDRPGHLLGSGPKGHGPAVEITQPDDTLDLA
jgi:hypothetical protein